MNHQHPTPTTQLPEPYTRDTEEDPGQYWDLRLPDGRQIVLVEPTEGAFVAYLERNADGSVAAEPDEQPTLHELRQAHSERRFTYKTLDGVLRCTYCGSVHPDDFMERVEAGESVTPTDKDYKTYIGGQKFYFDHLSVEQHKAFVELVNAKRVAFETPGRFYVLPFFMDFADEPG